MNLEVEPEESDETYDKDRVSIPFDDREYNSRIPSKNYYSYKMLEQLAFKSEKDNSKVKSYIICPGFLYGCGEDIFYEYYKVN